VLLLAVWLFAAISFHFGLGAVQRRKGHGHRLPHGGVRRRAVSYPGEFCLVSRHNLLQKQWPLGQLWATKEWYATNVAWG